MAKPVDEDEQRERDIARLDAAAQLLMEHFDSVQIFATRYDGYQRGTAGASAGRGNWYARYGAVKEWVRINDHPTRPED
jgi:hypothetical protein